MPPDIHRFVDTIIGWRCWYVSAGGSVGSSFSLSFGGKRHRGRRLRNPAQTEEYREYEGEAHLLVWCTWRLDGPSGPVVSSDQNPDRIDKALQTICGRTLTRAKARPPAWDLDLTFTGDYELVLLCDHLPGDNSIDSNWELRVRDDVLYVGPGYDYSFARE